MGIEIIKETDEYTLVYCKRTSKYYYLFKDKLPRRNNGRSNEQFDFTRK